MAILQTRDIEKTSHSVIADINTPFQSECHAISDFSQQLYIPHIVFQQSNATSIPRSCLRLLEMGLLQHQNTTEVDRWKLSGSLKWMLTAALQWLNFKSNDSQMSLVWTQHKHAWYIDTDQTNHQCIHDTHLATAIAPSSLPQSVNPVMLHWHILITTTISTHSTHTLHSHVNDSLTIKLH